LLKILHYIEIACLLLGNYSYDKNTDIKTNPGNLLNASYRLWQINHFEVCQHAQNYTSSLLVSYLMTDIVLFMCGVLYITKQYQTLVIHFNRTLLISLIRIGRNSIDFISLIKFIL